MILKIKAKRLVLTAVTLGVVFFAPACAQASEQTMIYEVYAGGIHALQAELKMKVEGGRYDVTLTAQTRGFLGKVAPWEGVFESHGWVEKDGIYKPELHKSTAIWRGEKEIKEYRYTREGKFAGFIETLDGKENKHDEASAELTDGTTDALSAAMNVFERVANGQPCEGSDEVFDGKRRFEQIFTDKGTAELEPTKYNIFKGKAAECTVEIKEVAGAWHKKPRGWMSIQEQGRAKGTMPTIWLAAMLKDDPAIPVKIRIATAYGVLFMHLAHYSDGERSVSAEREREE